MYDWNSYDAAMAIKAINAQTVFLNKKNLCELPAT